MKVSLKKIITSLFACILFTVSMISNITVSAACQPKLYLLANNMRTYTAKPGETVTITYNVDAPDHTWCATGVHINYDKRLTTKLDNRTGEFDYTKGPVASSLSMIVEPYETDELKGVFVCTYGSGNSNDGSGTVMSFEVDVPANAKSGDKYPIEFWFRETENAKDIFTDYLGDKSITEYAFTNAKNCLIVIK